MHYFKRFGQYLFRMKRPTSMLTLARRFILLGLTAIGVPWMSISGRDLVDRVVPALARFVPLEDRVLADAKYQARAAALEAAARRRQAFDLVILGDSHAEYAGDPRLFPGIEMLNLGIARDTTVGCAPPRHDAG